tara:strand:+ start:357 stop:839 length:483 start_codon:yes stop_codon:yes gene_type:complete
MDSDILKNIDNKENNEEIDECCICLNLLQGELAELSCGHVYHLECVTEWISKKNNYRKACCICENDTEIVNIFYKMKTHKYKIEEPILERKKSNDLIYNKNEIQYIESEQYENNTNLNNQFNYNTIDYRFDNNNNSNNRIVHQNMIESSQRNDYKCCNIL